MNRPGLDNLTNNEDVCIPVNVPDPSESVTMCTRSKDSDNSVTGNNYEFYSTFVPDDAAAVGAVVVGVDGQQAVDAELARRRREMHGVARVVGADAGDDRRAVRSLAHGSNEPLALRVFLVEEKGLLLGEVREDGSWGDVRLVGDLSCGW